MNHQFTFVSEETSCLTMALELALRSKPLYSSTMFHGWSEEGSTLTLHTNIAMAKHPLPCALSVIEASGLVRAWYAKGKPPAMKHDFDVHYHKAYRIDGHPFDEQITITITETEYHK